MVWSPLPRPVAGRRLHCVATPGTERQRHDPSDMILYETPGRDVPQNFFSSTCDRTERHPRRPHLWQCEVAATKRAFREVFRRGRCLVPVEVFHEWTMTRIGRQP